MNVNPNDPSPYNPYAPPVAEPAAAAPSFDSGILADRGTRFIARFVDNLILVASALPMIIVEATSREDMALLAGSLAVFCVVTGYQAFLIATTGQSLAKRWARVRIVRADGRPVGFVSGVLLREWLPWLVGVIPLVGTVLNLFDSVSIFAADQRCLHDRVAGTKVVVVLESAVRPSPFG